MVDIGDKLPVHVPATLVKKQSLLLIGRGASLNVKQEEDTNTSNACTYIANCPETDVSVQLRCYSCLRKEWERNVIVVERFKY